MDKIFDLEVQKYMLDCGISQQQINKIKYDKCKTNAINLLQKVIELLRKSDYVGIEELTSHSPSGDDMGCENDYIDFGGCCGHEYFDILLLCAYLKQLEEEK